MLVPLYRGRRRHYNSEKAKTRVFVPWLFVQVDCFASLPAGIPAFVSCLVPSTRTTLLDHPGGRCNQRIPNDSQLYKRNFNSNRYPTGILEVLTVSINYLTASDISAKCQRMITVVLRVLTVSNQIPS